MDDPQPKWSCERDGKRYRMPHAEEAWIEVPSPAGPTRQMALIEFSKNGLAFGLEDGFPEPAPGEEIHGVTVSVGRFRFRGDVRVSHVTTGFSTGSVCGARFRAATGQDQFELVQLLDELEAQSAAQSEGSA